MRGTWHCRGYTRVNEQSSWDRRETRTGRAGQAPGRGRTQGTAGTALPRRHDATTLLPSPRERGRLRPAQRAPPTTPPHLPPGTCHRPGANVRAAGRPKCWLQQHHSSNTIPPAFPRCGQASPPRRALSCPVVISPGIDTVKEK